MFDNGVLPSRFRDGRFQSSRGEPIGSRRRGGIDVMRSKILTGDEGWREIWAVDGDLSAATLGLLDRKALMVMNNFTPIRLDTIALHQNVEKYRGPLEEYGSTKHKFVGPLELLLCRKGSARREKRGIT
ncbi:unnamed protein product [Lactuca saligna]|uniref:Uncharacterized protein n=1 Tax=Lactuca saligna TaxID=75948 RepID=A0AA36EAX9_LACSI|nr:unnamed protein product [Lactuca saligna]